jgi:hypothetical protein
MVGVSAILKDEGSGRKKFFAKTWTAIIRPDNTVFMAQIQSAPFTTPTNSLAV